jgi:hypothetical protein
MLTATVMIDTQPGTAAEVAREIQVCPNVEVRSFHNDRIAITWRGRTTQDLIDLSDKLRAAYPDIDRIEPTAFESDL